MSRDLTVTGWRTIWCIKIGALSLALTHRAPEYDLSLPHLEGESAARTPDGSREVRATTASPTTGERWDAGGSTLLRTLESWLLGQATTESVVGKLFAYAVRLDALPDDARILALLAQARSLISQKVASSLRVGTSPEDAAPSASASSEAVHNHDFILKSVKYSGTDDANPSGVTLYCRGCGSWQGFIAPGWPSPSAPSREEEACSASWLPDGEDLAVCAREKGHGGSHWTADGIAFIDATPASSEITLRGALRFYANKENWRWQFVDGHQWQSRTSTDHGDRARAALSLPSSPEASR